MLEMVEASEVREMTQLLKVKLATTTRPKFSSQHPHLPLQLPPPSFLKSF